MGFKVFVQLSLGRFAVEVNEKDSIRDIKKALRGDQRLAHVPLGKFRVNVNGTYLSDESKPLSDFVSEEGTTLHLVRKAVCEAASVNTEIPVDE